MTSTDCWLGFERALALCCVCVCDKVDCTVHSHKITYTFINLSGDDDECEFAIVCNKSATCCLDHLCCCCLMLLLLFLLIWCRCHATLTTVSCLPQCPRGGLAASSSAATASNVTNSKQMSRSQAKSVSCSCSRYTHTHTHKHEFLVRPHRVRVCRQNERDRQTEQTRV